MKFLKNILDILRDFLIHRKESKNEEFHMVRNIYNILKEDDPILDECVEIYKKITKLVNEYKVESDKEYSEKKYKIYEEWKELFELGKAKKQEYFSKLFTQYHDQTNGILTDDLQLCILYLEDSKWYDKKFKKYFEFFKKELENSDVTKDMNNLSSYFD